jgi:hypothetical protein
MRLDNLRQFKRVFGLFNKINHMDRLLKAFTIRINKEPKPLFECVNLTT